MPSDDPYYNEAETERRREDALKRMLNTPPQRHNESASIRKGKAKGHPAKPKSSEA
jgi:hypothetical protein